MNSWLPKSSTNSTCLCPESSTPIPPQISDIVPYEMPHNVLQSVEAQELFLSEHTHSRRGHLASRDFSPQSQKSCFKRNLRNFANFFFFTPPTTLNGPPYGTTHTSKLSHCLLTTHISVPSITQHEHAPRAVIFVLPMLLQGTPTLTSAGGCL